MKEIIFTDGSLWLKGKHLEEANKLKDDKMVINDAGLSGKGITVKAFFEIIYPHVSF